MGYVVGVMVMHKVGVEVMLGLGRGLEPVRQPGSCSD